MTAIALYATFAACLVVQVGLTALCALWATQLRARVASLEGPLERKAMVMLDAAGAELTQAMEVVRREAESILADAEKEFDRSKRYRAAASAAESRMNQAASANGATDGETDGFSSREEYREHLEKGGPRSAVAEAAFGL